MLEYLAGIKISRIRWRRQNISQTSKWEKNQQNNDVEDPICVCEREHTYVQMTKGHAPPSSQQCLPLGSGSKMCPCVFLGNGDTAFIRFPKVSMMSNRSKGFHQSRIEKFSRNVR